MIRDIGVCTWIFGELSLPEIARRLSALDFDGVELMGNLAAYTATEASNILADHNLKVFSLTPDNVDLAHPDDNVRQTAIDYYLRLLDFAAGLGQPLVSCHGFVGRVQASSSQAKERLLLVQAVQYIAARAETLGLKIVIEVLNRYESHLINTSAQAVEFVRDVDANNVGILLDAYHMNIEEQNPADALRDAGQQLWLYHAADSNRAAIGRGHTDFGEQMTALSGMEYYGPVILECTAPGPNPFTPIKDSESIAWLEIYLTESLHWLRNSTKSQA
jgi:sugar phosphate isomerase/epimerase